MQEKNFGAALSSQNVGRLLTFNNFFHFKYVPWVRGVKPGGDLPLTIVEGQLIGSRILFQILGWIADILTSNEQS